MADNDMGILSQADLDALMAAASEDTAGEESEFGGLGEDLESGLGEDLESGLGEAPEPTPMRAMGMVDLPAFDFPAMADPVMEEGASGLGRVRDIPLEVTVELGRTKLLIRDIMDLAAGSIIELDKIAGEPVDLFANGMLVARGEVIVIDDNFGVRVTEIITAIDRKMEKDAHARAA
jgi:flagellar motor switch protein FliN